MAWFIAVLLAQTVGGGATPSPLGPIYSQPSTANAVDYADFELAPTTGAGMTAECACADVTGASGQTVTWARSSSAYCTKEGLATTGLTTTSMVLCGSNQPRVEATYDGVKGLRRENTATNLMLRSDEINLSPWATSVFGGRTITITADAGVTAWGAGSADQVALSGTTGASQNCEFNQVLSVTTGVPYVGSFYVQGVSGGDTVYSWFYDGTAVQSQTACTFVTPTITRCVNGPWTSTKTSASGVFAIGLNTFHGQPNVPATTFLVSGIQVEVSTQGPTSYIATTSGTATRNPDIITGVVSPGIAAATGSFSAKVWIQNAVGNSGILGLHNSIAGTFDTMAHNNATTVDLYVGGVAKTSTVPIPDAGVFFSTAGFWGASTSLTVNSATVTGTAGAASAELDRITVGSYVGGNVMSGIFSEICADHDATRCQ